MPFAAQQRRGMQHDADRRQRFVRLTIRQGIGRQGAF
jgi:hypothetical protein